MNSIFQQDVSLSFVVARIFYPIWVGFGLLLYVFHLPRRKGILWKAPLFVLLVFAVSFLVPVNTPFVPVNAICILFCFILALYCLFALSFKAALFYGSSIFLLQNMSWNLSYGIEVSLIHNEIDSLAGAFPFLRLDTGLIFSFSCFVCYLLCYLLFVRPQKKQSDNNIKNWKLAVYSVLTILVVFIISDAINSSKIPESSVLRYSLTVTCFSLFASLYASSMSDQLEIEKQVMDSLFKKEQKNYENLKMNIETMNKRAHDLKYQLMDLEKGADISNLDYIRNLKASLSLYERSPKTGCAALDNTLNEKVISCENQSILFLYRVDGSRLSFMDALDVYVLFGNAIDNAIECVIRYDDVKKRTISMNSYQKGNLLKFHIENPCLDDVVFDKGIPHTRKKDAIFHGYGTKSMMEIVKKYQGTISFSNKDGIFSVDFLFMLDDN